MQLLFCALALLLLASLPAAARLPAAEVKCRDAGTGKYVTAKYAKKHPRTTVCESE